MPVLPAPTEPTHDIGGATFTSLTTPTRGATDTAVWRVRIHPGTEPTPHSLTREEVFVVLEGTATVRLDGTVHQAGPGDAIVVPPDVELHLESAGDQPVELLCCLPVGGKACFPDGTTFTPPWAE